MDTETFKSRVNNLIARTRKAIRLYSNPDKYASVNKSKVQIQGVIEGRELFNKEFLQDNGCANNFSVSDSSSVIQNQWRNITNELLKDLVQAVQKSETNRALSAAVFTIRDKYNTMWRSVESEMHIQQKELVSFSQAGEFAKAFNLCSKLVAVKACYQAAQAAHHELEELIKNSHCNQEPIVLTGPMEIDFSNDGNFPENLHKSVANFSSKASGTGLKPAKVIPIRKVL